MARPGCGGNMSPGRKSVDCTVYNGNSPIRLGRIYFCAPPPQEESLDSVKQSLRHLLGSTYPFLVEILGPTLLPNYLKVHGQYVDPSRHSVVHTDSDNRRVHADTLCVDWKDHHEVDVVCKLLAFPFKSNSLDGVTGWNV